MGHRMLTKCCSYRQLKLSTNEQWLLMGDYNLIYRACDKSNLHINR
jgi:hypothetical protein